jgi:hypothetical protein
MVSGYGLLERCFVQIPKFSRENKECLGLSVQSNSKIKTLSIYILQLVHCKLVRASPLAYCTLDFGQRLLKLCLIGLLKWIWLIIFAQYVEIDKNHCTF